MNPYSEHTGLSDGGGKRTSLYLKSDYLCQRNQSQEKILQLLGDPIQNWAMLQITNNTGVEGIRGNNDNCGRSSFTAWVPGHSSTASSLLTQLAGCLCPLLSCDLFLKFTLIQNIFRELKFFFWLCLGHYFNVWACECTTWKGGCHGNFSLLLNRKIITLAKSLVTCQSIS